ncbi:phage tail tube protein, partial [Streptococcus pneumoniae]|uniref:phage tail tube protein n=1 Tax=Streptococcus pneumoniae TaxID=1313 RepID=UPI003F69CD90
MILTKGTQLFILDPRTPPFAEVITKLDGPKSITGLGLSTPQIDTTCLDSEAMEFVP